MPLTDDEIRDLMNGTADDHLLIRWPAEMNDVFARLLSAEAEVRRLNRYDWLKPDAYEKAAAERDALQARVRVLEEALREIAAQKIHKEITNTAPDEIDWLGGYEGCVERARKAL
jgi:hypothetical protein